MIVFVPKQKPAEAEGLLSAQASSVLVWMSVVGQKATFPQLSGMSALLPKPDVAHL
jgi:hypothetical protein